MARYGSGADLARELGISRQAVSKAEKSGRISRAASGLFDLDAAAIQYRLHTDPEQQARSLQQRSGGTEVLDPPAVEVRGDAAALISAKARREQAEAQLAEMKLAEAMGSAMNIAEHKRVIFALGRAVTDALLQMPSRLGAVVAAESNQLQCQALIEAEVRKVLEQLARWRPDADPSTD